MNVLNEALSRVFRQRQLYLCLFVVTLFFAPKEVSFRSLSLHMCLPTHLLPQCTSPSFKRTSSFVRSYRYSCQSPGQALHVCRGKVEMGWVGDQVEVWISDICHEITFARHEGLLETFNLIVLADLKVRASSVWFPKCTPQLDSLSQWTIHSRTMKTT